MVGAIVGARHSRLEYLPVGSSPAHLGGINVAAVTPHRLEGHEADLAATLELIDYLNEAGVSSIALLGSTGEFLHLTFEHRIRLLNMAVKRSRVPIVAGASHSTLDGTLALARQATDAGAAALLVMPPHFFRYDQDDITEFYLRFSDHAAQLAPVFLYNIPFFTSPLSADTACELLRTGRFAGIKDSSGKLEYFAQLNDLKARIPFTLLIGNDAIFTKARIEGADGVVSGCACAVPELLLALDRAIASRDAARIDLLESHLQCFISWLERFPTPVGVKEATAARGLKVGPLAVPLPPRKQKELEDFRNWFQSWLPKVRKDAEA